MNDIKKIVLFKNEISKEGGSWVIIRDGGYEIVSLKEGRRICLEYAAMNGITTEEMANEKLYNKVVFYSPDFISAFRDHIVEYIFNYNNYDGYKKKSSMRNNAIVLGRNDNLTKDDFYDRTGVSENGLIGEPVADEYNIPVDDAEVATDSEKGANQFVMVGDSYVPVEVKDDSNSSEPSEVFDSKFFSKVKDEVDNIPEIDDAEVAADSEKGANQFVMVGDSHSSTDESNDSNSSEPSEVSDSKLFSKVKDEVDNIPVEDDAEVAADSEKGANQFVMVGDSHSSTDESNDSNSSETSELLNNDDTNEDENEEDPTSEEEEVIEEEPTSEEEVIQEETTSEDDEEETLDEEDIGIIDRIKRFGNGVLEKLKEFTIFGTIVGMLVAGIVSIFGVKYSLNRDKDDIYVTHSSNIEESADDEDLYTNPFAKFVDGVINKFFPTKESVTDEENENEKILMGDDTDLEIESSNTDNNSNQYVPYSFERESNDSDVEKIVTTASDEENECDNYEDLDDYLTYYDTDESKLVETAADTDTNKSKLVETAADTDTNESWLVETAADSDFYDIARDTSEDVVLINNEESSDEVEYFEGYNDDNTLNITTDSTGDQTDLELPDPNYLSTYIDDYINSLESKGDVSESGKQYIKAA